MQDLSSILTQRRKLSLFGLLDYIRIDLPIVRDQRSQLLPVFNVLKMLIIIPRHLHQNRDGISHKLRVRIACALLQEVENRNENFLFLVDIELGKIEVFESFWYMFETKTFLRWIFWIYGFYLVLIENQSQVVIVRGLEFELFLLWFRLRLVYVCIFLVFLGLCLRHTQFSIVQLAISTWFCICHVWRMRQII